ncbi:MAG: CRISPR-associated ring nuclease Csm6 [Alcaligenaceae bacterium]|nr:CRISPR-associated ring nuclease Csm6 [Alcaligenaceae bacterium]
MSKTKNILFLVTGMTPAIITETIWALACDPELDEGSRWIPDEVQVLSTEHGLNQIKSKLIENGIFEQFKSDYPQIANTKFDASLMYAIKGADGKALSDLRTPEDNEYAADEINERINQLTKDENTTLHVSIAGGRKTMGFYAGYALSLHGRAQDRMSHILVDERFESIHDFFYPTPTERFVKDRDGHSWDARTAQLWLAQIPFVRMKDAIKDRHQIKTNSFSETVRKINEANRDLHLSLDIKNKLLIINGSLELNNLPPKEFAFLCLFAQDRQQQGAGILAPKYNFNTENLPLEELNYISQLTQKFKEFYNQLREIDYIEDREIDVGKSYFERTKSILKAHLESELGLELAAKLEIQQNGRGQPFFLDINPASIEFI